MFDYNGVIHLHSNYSFDGNTPIKDIIASAEKNKVDFIIISDHGTLKAKQDGWEKWHKDVCVLIGEEISPRYNHVLAINIDKAVEFGTNDAEPQRYIDAVNAQGGLALISHPDHTGAPKFGVKDYPWQDWNAKRYAALSIWDLMTDWQEKLTGKIRAGFAVLFPTWFLSGPKQQTLSRWDELNKTSLVAGYGEVDNHNALRKWFGLKVRIFPFDYALSTIRTHVLLNEELSRDIKIARKQICGALKSARAYVAQERWKKSEAFSFEISNGVKTAFMGDDIALDQATYAKIKTSGRVLIKLILNGKIVVSADEETLEYRISEPGIYRVEVAQKIFGRYKPWIYSNPIRAFI